MRRTMFITGLLLAVLAPAAAAEARKPVTRAEVFAAAHRMADQSTAGLASRPAGGLKEYTPGSVRIDRSRTSVGNYLSYGRFRKGASFALFGTNTVNGEARTLWCIGNIEVVHTRSGAVRATTNLTCPVS